MLPAVTSPAVRAVPLGTTLDGQAVCGGTATDQRGEPRPYVAGSACTIGAVEQSPATQTPAQLAFTTQPPTATGTGQSFTVAVAVEDASGNLVTGDDPTP